MSDINTVTVSGRLTRDPELRTTPSGLDLCKIGIAVGRNKKTEGGEWEETVSFFDGTVFGNFGALVARKLRKGDQVAISGRLEQSSWEKDGEKRSKVELVINDVVGQGMFRTKDEETAPAATAAGTSSAQQTSIDAPDAKPDDDIPF